MYLENRKEISDKGADIHGRFINNVIGFMSNITAVSQNSMILKDEDMTVVGESVAKYIKLLDMQKEVMADYLYLIKANLKEEKNES